MTTPCTAEARCAPRFRVKDRVAPAAFHFGAIAGRAPAASVGAVQAVIYSETTSGIGALAVAGNTGFTSPPGASSLAILH